MRFFSMVCLLGLSINSNAQDSIQVYIDSMHYDQYLSGAENVVWLQISQMRPSNKDIILSDSIKQFKNLEFLDFGVKRKLIIEPGLDSLKKLKEVHMMGRYEKHSKISFAASKKSLEFLVVHNEGPFLILPEHLETYERLWGLSIYSSATRIDVDQMISFFKSVESTKIHAYLIFENLSEKKIADLNNRLMSAGIKSKLWPKSKIKYGSHGIETEEPHAYEAAN